MPDTCTVATPGAQPRPATRSRLRAVTAELLAPFLTDSDQATR